MKRLVVACACLVTVLWPAQASASWFLGLGAGVVKSDSLEGTPATYTGQLGKVADEGIMGFELDFGYANQTDAIGTRTFEASLLVGPKVGRFRPYGSVGGGIIGAVTRFTDIFRVSGTRPNDPLASFGGGVFVDLSSKFGVRFDVRQMVDTKKPAGASSRFQFTRVTANVHLTF